MKTSMKMKIFTKIGRRAHSIWLLKVKTILLTWIGFFRVKSSSKRPNRLIKGLKWRKEGIDMAIVIKTFGREIITIMISKDIIATFSKIRRWTTMKYHSSLQATGEQINYYKKKPNHIKIHLIRRFCGIKSMKKNTAIAAHRIHFMNRMN